MLVLAAMAAPAWGSTAPALPGPPPTAGQGFPAAPAPGTIPPARRQPVARNVGRKRAMGLALSGDVIDARTALDWGLVNRVVPAARLDDAVRDLLERTTRGSAQSKGIGKQALYAQIDLDQPKAYAYAIEVMAATSQLPDAQEGIRAFLEKRKPHWRHGRQEQ